MQPSEIPLDYPCPNCGQHDFRLEKIRAVRGYLYKILCANCRFHVGTGFPV